ncbi:UvrD-helicase domain-containing protein [Salegentibacter sediminis]|uniref:UvrD-helicase domain-containing protein n=1 Tax=Salegentibacter sediminis TaxID=1930251 RepID=UPI0009BCB116|nr:UvrD-helicase domain-containing protein [Salegentibacter sediminis]
MKHSFNIYNASAGSGKTFTLVKEYLILLINSSRPDAYKNILAITFTNKAVEEMKTRIISSLHNFSKTPVPEDSFNLFNAVKQATGFPGEEIQLKSARILKNIIHNYSAFEISTIDGFTQRILRSFAKDLGLSVNFEVSLNTEQILLEAVEALIAQAGTDKALTKILKEFALSKTDDEKSWDITADLFEISKLLTNENNHLPLSKLKGKSLEDFEKFSKKLKAEKESTKNIIKSSVEIFFGIMQDHNLEFSDFTGSYLPKHFKKLEEGKTPNFSTKWIQTLETAPLYKKDQNEHKKSLLDSLQPQFCELFRASEKAIYHVEFLTEIEKRLVQLSLLNAINQQVEIIKKERNLLLISEFNPMISAQVKDQPAPFIYEKLGERYQNYFIDEFQDTSKMQWENLQPLVEHSLSGEPKEGEPAGLMLVGDAKQSIYRWRGGKAEQFIDLYNLQAKPFSIDQKVEDLPDNYRSAGEIVNFNNNLFQFASASLRHPSYSELFENSAQTPKKENNGYVDISFIEANTSAEEFEIYPEKVLEIIQDLDEKAFSRGDICILTRRKKEGIAIASYLSEQGIPVVSSETLLVANSPAVNFIVNLLAFSINPKDDNIKLEIFSFLQEKLQLEASHQIISENLRYNEDAFFHWLREYDIDFSLEALKNLSLYESGEYIIRSFSLVETSDAYIQFFLDYIFETTQKSVTGIADFLDLWEQKKEKLSIAVPEEDNAVKIMTIHSSKGLEFPIVIYPFANSGFQDTRMDSLWLDLPEALGEIPVSYMSASKKMLNWGDKASEVYQELLDQKELDTLNVLYVACTRASAQLYILSKLEIDKKGNENPAKISGLLIGFLKNMGKWVDGQLQYSFGKLPQPRPGERGSNSQVQEHFYSTPTQNQAVHIVTRSGALWDTKQEEAIEKGEIIHDILANINTREDSTLALEQAVLDGTIASEALPQISKVIESIIMHPQLIEFFSPDASNLNERDILIDGGKRLRPDRLNFKENEVSILDYKTGNYKNSHALQINRYAETLQNMGFKPGRKILVYINKELSLEFV